MRGEKGFALVLTLVVTALMVAVVAEMIHQVYVDVSLSRGFRDGQQASLLAESGITGGTKLLQFVLSKQQYSSLTDRWAQPLKLDDETGTVEIVAAEESGKINLNNLLVGGDDSFTLKALKRLGERLKIPVDCWNALADWLDSDDDPRSSGGAEAPYYKTLKPAYSPRNNRLATLSELSLVEGFTPEIIAKLRPFVTVYGQTGDLININTAPKEVLVALNPKIDDRMADRIIEERKLKPFTVLGNLGERVDNTIVSPLTGYAGTIGNIFKITSVAKVKDTYRTVMAVVRLSGGTLSWQEY